MGLAKAGGALLEKLGITQLSALIIDADKDWQAMGISSIREVAAGMQKGDLALFDGAGIVILSPGPIGTILTTQGLGALPIWSHP
jgi:hypothetical protein